MRSTDYGSGYLYGNSGKSLGGNAGPNAVRQVTKSGGAVVNFSYDNEGNLLTGDGLTISYTSFKQPSSISRSGNSFSFGYGARLERVKEVRNSLTTYEIDKAYEKSSDGSWKLYLDDVAIISHSSADGHRIAYSHKDRLGSSVTFTDHNGQVTGRRHYDAFGKPRQISGALMEPAHRPKQLNFSNFAGVDNAGITRRGFTDHRHLDEAELIHMNGRGYDYNLGRFLSVDPIIQSPGNSQSLNPYSYIMNNPLAGTDPTGYTGCAASKIDSVCDSTLSNYGGNGLGDIKFGLTFTAKSFSGGNGSLLSQSGSGAQSAGGSSGSAADLLGQSKGSGQKAEGNSNTTFLSGLTNGVADNMLQSAWNDPINPLLGVYESPADMSGYSYVSPLDQPSTDIAQLGKDVAPWAMLVVGLLSRNPAGVADNAVDAASMVNNARKFSYGPNDPPVRIQGEWSDTDIMSALRGRTPKGLGSPDLHHADQMPGSAIHEVLPSVHRGNKELHPNRYNQGVTPQMRQQDKQLHWWYRAREQGADQKFPDLIYDN